MFFEIERSLAGLGYSHLLLVIGPRPIAEKLRQLSADLNRLSRQWQILFFGARVAGNTEALAGLLFDAICHRVDVLRRHVGIDGVFVLSGFYLPEKVVGNTF